MADLSKLIKKKTDVGRPRKLTKEETIEAAELIIAGNVVDSVADAFDCTANTLRASMDRFGVKIKQVLEIDDAESV